MTNRLHFHVFDSRYGLIRCPLGPYLMCRCGVWGMPSARDWRPVPMELLPRTLVYLAQMRRAGAILRNCVIALAIGTLLAWLVWI